MLKRLEVKIFVRIAFLFLTLLTLSFLLIKGAAIYLVFLLPVIIYQLTELFRFQNRANKELKQFVESIQYRDFSRNFDATHGPAELKALRETFNRVNSTIQGISREKETSFQYLQKILELVDTGIVSYDLESGEVIWMNDALKKMLQLPYLKNIHSLERRDEELYKDIISLKPGEGKISKAHLEKRTCKILLSATAFQTAEKKFFLIAFQNINEALDETESKAWQKLLSVMTHEIMNSVAPISSLADTLKNRLTASAGFLDNKAGAVHDLEIGIETIKRRSESLLKFAEIYRNLNKITAPNVTSIYIRDLFENLFQLMEPTLEKKNIEMDIVLKDTGLMVEADQSLIEQVLINLVVNAMEAVKEIAQARIILSASLSEKQKILIKVSDNGTGIMPDVIENIFIPFFSTRKTGSGIGLSLCKQIMMLHKGNIHVQSRPGEGSVFTLQF